mmetsp:Transcript_4875/g.15879  ORF Transcript_4875/g.15879 Transcript_4875/m.15879 type:complete len:80 (+) Transcript_4875:21-260(+)
MELMLQPARTHFFIIHHHRNVRSATARRVHPPRQNAGGNGAHADSGEVAKQRRGRNASHFRAALVVASPRASSARSRSS